MLEFNFYLCKQDYGLWNEDDSKNIEFLVLEAKNERKMDNNTKLLLDAVPRSALGYEFSLEKVYIYFKFCLIISIGIYIIGKGN